MTGELEPIEEVDTSGLLDAPNQQVVRPDGSGPADEGEGGTVDDERVVEEPAEENSPEDLDGLTKPELLARAQELGAKPANAAMSKDELRAAIDDKLAES